MTCPWNTGGGNAAAGVDEEVISAMPALAGKAARYAAIPLLAFLALAAWTLSSPVGSSPDEDYHLVSIWCGHGDVQGRCESAGVSDERKVPEALPKANCYAFHPEKSAGCQKKYFYKEDDKLVPTTRGNFTGDYPPVFYFTMSFFVGHDISKSVLLMRLVNSALFVGLMTLTYWLLPRSRRTMLALGVGVTLVPLGMFLIPSINPSSWSVWSAAVVFAAVVGYLETTGRRRMGLAVVATAATVMGAGSRADSAVYAALAVVLAVLVNGSWRRGGRRPLLLPLLLCVVCVFFYKIAGQNGAVSDTAPTHQTMNALQQIGHNLLNVPGLWAGSFGYWGLGWLDTYLPSGVWVINLITFGAALFAGLRQSTPRKKIAITVTLVAMWLVPTWVLYQSSALVGVGVQPRYLLPLLVLLAEVALLRIDPRRLEFNRTQMRCVVGALTATNAVSLQVNIRRYVTGTDVSGYNLDAHREWWWAIPLPPMGVWLLGSLAFGGALYLVARALRTHSADVVAQSPTPSVERQALDGASYDGTASREAADVAPDEASDGAPREGSQRLTSLPSA